MVQVRNSPLRYLSRRDVIACKIEPRELVVQIKECFLAVAQGRAIGSPTFAIPASSSNRFVAKGGIFGEPPVGAIKWFGYFPDRGEGVPDFHPLILLNEATGGMPLAVMDGTWISEFRTAGITGLAAILLAQPDTTRLGFIACGAQARAHLQLLTDLFPITTVYAYSRRALTTAAFCRQVEAMGLKAIACEAPRSAIEDSQIVITSVPHVAPDAAFLDGSWIAPGTVVSMVDRGASWQLKSLDALDFAFTDDLTLSGPGGTELINFDPHRLAGDLAGLVKGGVGSRPESDRVALIFTGAGIVDVAVARLTYERACQRGIGTMLDL